METISQKTAQQIVDTVKSICGFDINFINAEGIVLASTAPGRIGSFHEAGRRAILAGDTIEVKDDGLFYGARRGVNLPVFYHGGIIAAIGITGEVDAVRGYGALARRITDMLLRERDLYVQGSQRQSSLHYIIDSLAKGIPITQAWLDAFLEEYRIDRSDLYRTLVIRLDTRYNPGNLPLIQQRVSGVLERAGSPLYAFFYPGEYVLFFKDRQLSKLLPLFKALGEELKDILRIGVGSPRSILQQSLSYQDAVTAAESLADGRFLASYEELDLDLILSGCPADARSRFLQKTIAALSPEDQALLAVYFEEDQSLVRTCRRLFLHKNTLQYRLVRIRRLCGYDPRAFREGAVLYMALRAAGTADANRMENADKAGQPPR